LIELLSENRWIQTVRASPALNAAAEDFVIKRARPDFTSDFDRDFARGLLEREAEVGGQVTHRHLATILEVLEGDAGTWLVQPLLLASSVTVAEKQTTAKTLWAVRQTAEALLALHQNDWLHGNVTPDAIVVGSDGHATLGDLGWSRRLLSDECDLAHTRFAGHLRYAAPELFDDAGSLTVAADVYSLGTILFELLTGDPPYARHVGPQLVAAKRLMSVDQSELAGEHYQVSTLVTRMLSRDPLRRPTMGEVVEALISLEIKTFGGRSAQPDAQVRASG
jgi:serine/threonine protein kinase